MEKPISAYFINVPFEIDDISLKVNVGDYKLILRKVSTPTEQTEFSNTLVPSFKKILNIIKEYAKTKVEFFKEKAIKEHKDYELLISNGYIGLGEMIETKLVSVNKEDKTMKCLTFFNWVYYSELGCYMQPSFEFSDGEEWINIIIPV